MKYMHSEWKGRLRHWIETLKQDLYLPMQHALCVLNPYATEE